jgi:hypothetical protein
MAANANDNETKPKPDLLTLALEDVRDLLQEVESLLEKAHGELAPETLAAPGRPCQDTADISALQGDCRAATGRAARAAFGRSPSSRRSREKRPAKKPSPAANSSTSDQTSNEH